MFRICDAQRSAVVYVEYFGGWHPQASHHGPGNNTPVQKHVAYSPKHHFYAFDVLVDGTWLSFDEASESLSRAGFELIAKPLARGTFDDCLAVDVDHLETKLPKQLGYPLAWPGSPGDALRNLQDPCGPSRSQLNQVTWATAYSGSQLHLVYELITWVTAYQEQDQPDSFDEENIPCWARKTSLTGTR